MKRIALIFSTCLLSLALFSGCEKCDLPAHEGDEIAPSALLTAGPWDLEAIEFTHYKDGGQGENWTEDYGPGTENGICTFEFFDDYECVMIDENDEADEPYTVYSDGNMRIGDKLFRIEELSEERLELVVFYGECGDYEDDDDDDEEAEDEDDDEDFEEEHMYFKR